MDNAITLKDRGAIEASSRWSRPMDRRSYLGAVGGFTALGLIVMAIESLIMGTPEANAWLDANPMAYLVILLVTLAGSIGGIVLQCIGRNREGRMQVGMVAAGYGMLVVSLGFAIACALTQYDLGSIASAFVAASALSVGMTLLGFVFPQFFQRIAGILFGLLIGVIIGEVVLLVLGLSQTWLDWLVLAVFSGFIAVDTYRAANDAPCMANALFWASSIYIDFVNIFLTILELADRD